MKTIDRYSADLQHELQKE